MHQDFDLAIRRRGTRLRVEYLQNGTGPIRLEEREIGVSLPRQRLDRNVQAVRFSDELRGLRRGHAARAGPEGEQGLGLELG